MGPQGDIGKRNALAMKHYNQGVSAHQKGLWNRAIQEYERALEYDPSPEGKMLILFNYAMEIWVSKNNFDKRNGASVPDEEYKDAIKVVDILNQTISLYEELSEDEIMNCDLPLKDIYDNAKNNRNAFCGYGQSKRKKDGSFRLRNMDRIIKSIKEGTILKEEEEKSGCFIATAACGTPLAEEVIWLSRFRDNVLAKRAMGVNFINFYYKISPPIASWVSRYNLAKVMVRTLVVRPLSKLARLFT